MRAGRLMRRAPVINIGPSSTSKGQDLYVRTYIGHTFGKR